jgi:hypothetical protein
MTRIEIIKALCFLNSTYQDKFKYPIGDEKKDDMTVEAWLEFLRSYPANQVMSTIKYCMLEDPEWPPTPAKIAKEIITHTINQNPTPTEAWSIALQVIKKQIKHEDVPKSVHKAIQFIGYDNIAYSKTSDTFIMHDFIKAYKEILARNKTQRFNEISSGNIKQIENKK